MFKKLLDKINLAINSSKPVVKKRRSKIQNDGESVPVKPSLKRIPDKLMIRKKERVPDYDLVISSKDSVFPLTVDQKLNFIVLLKEETKEITFITSVEHAENQRNDVEFLSLKERLLSHNDGEFKIIRRMYSSRQLITLLYEKELVKQSIEEEVKNVKGLQAEFDTLLGEALREGVSDIHIEVRRDEAVVRFRKNGKLYNSGDWGVMYARQMAIVIYQVIADEKDVTFVESQQQAAIIDRQIDEHRVRVRLNTMPAYPDGFDMVMRLLRMGVENDTMNLEDLGYFEEQVELIKTAISKPVGVCVISGVTGSGKSTSLATMITNIIRKHETLEGVEIKVITVEDPPEYQIPFVTQSPVVNSRGGKSRAELFVEAIKAALRCDPDIIMIGEVRDKDSANLLTKAVLTGHKGFTTIHASSSIGIVGRMRAEGTPNDILGSKDFFAGLIYQTLVPTVCSCAISSKEYFETKNGDVDAKDLKVRLDDILCESEFDLLKFKNEKGCNKCNGKGISGRTVVAEIIIPDDEILEAIGQGDDNRAWQIFLRNGGKSVLDYGIDKMKMGICDPIDIEEKLGRVNTPRMQFTKEKELEIDDSTSFDSKLLSSNSSQSHNENNDDLKIKRVDFTNKNKNKD
jgi:type II secretory ATPase GspE/PulE/Tfp pilus assembly ATPase PilB-like protein